MTNKFFNDRVKESEKQVQESKKYMLALMCLIENHHSTEINTLAGTVNTDDMYDFFEKIIKTAY